MIIYRFDAGGGRRRWGSSSGPSCCSGSSPSASPASSRSRDVDIDAPQHIYKPQTHVTGVERAAPQHTTATRRQSNNMI